MKYALKNYAVNSKTSLVMAAVGVGIGVLSLFTQDWVGALALIAIGLSHISGVTPAIVKRTDA